MGTKGEGRMEDVELGVFIPDGGIALPSARNYIVPDRRDRKTAKKHTKTFARRTANRLTYTTN